MREAAGRHRQQGAVIITVALLTLFLLGFIGFALDFGRLFVVKSELQTAMDSCALAAAQELDLQPIGDRPRHQRRHDRRQPECGQFPVSDLEREGSAGGPPKSLSRIRPT